MQSYFKFIIIFILCITGCILVNAKEEISQEQIYEIVTNDDLIYIIDEANTFQYSWQFKQDQMIDYKGELNLKLKFNSPWQERINQKFKNKAIKRKHLHFEHHGDLPTTALIKVKVTDQFLEGDKLYLYYYNENTDTLEYINKDLVVKNGYVTFEINHCSDYILTGSIVREAINNPRGMTIIIIILIITIVIAIGATLFSNRK